MFDCEHLKFQSLKAHSFFIYEEKEDPKNSNVEVMRYLYLDHVGTHCVKHCEKFQC